MANRCRKKDASKHDIEHSKWYHNANKVVLSNTLNANDFDHTTVINKNLSENIKALKTLSDKEILVFGSPSATHSLIDQDLIDGYWLFVNPILLGNGVPLFKNIKEKTKLELINTNQFECGVTEMSYLVKR